jgi:phage nucleotide-binding protein
MSTATQEKARPAKLKKLTGDVKDEKHKILIYGKTGVGKTRFASDLATKFRVFMMCSELKRTSIISNPNFPAIKPNLDVWDALSWDDVKEGFNYVSDHQSEYDWVIVDSITDINKRIIEDINAASKEELMSQRDWGKVTMRLEKFIRFTRDLRTSVLFVALASGEKNELTGEITQYPSMTGKLKDEIPAYMNSVGYCYTAESREEPGKINRYISFQASPKAIAKDEFDCLAIEPLNMINFISKTKIG